MAANELAEERIISDATPSRTTRLLTSWKLWLVMLFISLVCIATTVVTSAYHRLQAIRFLAHEGTPVRFTDDSAWMTEWFGDAGTALRPIRSVNCSRIRSDDDFRRIAMLLDVPELHYGGFEPPSPMVRNALSHLTRLKEFSINGPYAGEYLVAVIESESPLNRVAVQLAEVSPEVFAALTRVSTITQLRVSRTCATHEDFRNCQPMPQLRTLSLWSNGLDVDWLLHSTHLKELQFGGDLTDDDFEKLAELQHLEVLELFLPDDYALTVDGIAHLDRLPRLHTIALPPELITPKTLETFRLMPNLETIDVMGRFSDDESRETVASEWNMSEWDRDNRQARRAKRLVPYVGEAVVRLFVPVSPIISTPVFNGIQPVLRYYSPLLSFHDGWPHPTFHFPTSPAFPAIIPAD